MHCISAPPTRAVHCASWLHCILWTRSLVLVSLDRFRNGALPGKNRITWRQRFFFFHLTLFLHVSTTTSSSPGMVNEVEGIFVPDSRRFYSSPCALRPFRTSSLGSCHHFKIVR
ncbi:hypothetical protein BDR05DRAFT_488039 [Suillus weaverae]|nr:hypothetical protein BDR05DRAFT_488039 [Suillus weaverae]